MYVVSSISGILMCEVYDTFWFTYGFHAFFRSYCENMDEESHLSIDEIASVYLFLSLFWYHVYLSLFSQLKAKNCKLPTRVRQSGIEFAETNGAWNLDIRTGVHKYTVGVFATFWEENVN